MSDLSEKIRNAVLTFEQEKLIEVVRESLEEGHDSIEIINAISSALREIGDKFSQGELFIVHLVVAGEAAKKAISEYLEPRLKEIKADRESVGRVVIGTVEGDIHDIGKNIVATLLFSAGFDVMDLGVDVPVKEFVEAVKKCNPDILGMSALLTTTMNMQREVIEALKGNNLRDKVKVMVGGAQVTGEWAKEIGADGYAEDAIEAVKVAKKLMEERK